MRMRAGTICTALALMLSAAVAGRCDDTTGTTADGTTGATWKASGKGVLPPDSVRWAVVGELDGLQGKIVKYNPRLYRGGQILSDKGVRQLKKLGVKTVISVTPTKKERELTKRHGLELIELPFDKNKAVSRDILGFFVQTVKEKAGPFYVHCGTGNPRASILLAEYRIRVDGLSCERAVAEFKNLGGNAETSSELIKTLQGWPESEQQKRMKHKR